jgi:hypothetical protein
MLFMRGPRGVDESARWLHFLLATLAAWMAAGFLITIPFAPSSLSGACAGGVDPGGVAYGDFSFAC